MWAYNSRKNFVKLNMLSQLSILREIEHQQRIKNIAYKRGQKYSTVKCRKKLLSLVKEEKRKICFESLVKLKEQPLLLLQRQEKILSKGRLTNEEKQDAEIELQPQKSSLSLLGAELLHQVYIRSKTDITDHSSDIKNQEGFCRGLNSEISEFSNKLRLRKHSICDMKVKRSNSCGIDLTSRGMGQRKYSKIIQREKNYKQRSSQRSSHNQSSQQLSRAQRCRRGLNFLISYAKRLKNSNPNRLSNPQHYEAKDSPIQETEPEEEISSQENNSEDLSPSYFKHIGSLLEDEIDEAARLFPLRKISASSIPGQNSQTCENEVPDVGEALDESSQLQVNWKVWYL